MTHTVTLPLATLFARAQEYWEKPGEKATSDSLIVFLTRQTVTHEKGWGSGENWNSCSLRYFCNYNAPLGYFGCYFLIYTIYRLYPRGVVSQLVKLWQGRRTAKCFSCVVNAKAWMSDRTPLNAPSSFALRAMSALASSAVYWHREPRRAVSLGPHSLHMPRLCLSNKGACLCSYFHGAAHATECVATNGRVGAVFSATDADTTVFAQWAM